MRSFHIQKKKKEFTLFWSVLFILGALLLFSLLSKHLGAVNKSEQTQLLETAVTRCITECYALEGAYPPDIAYLTEYYGLTYDNSQYFIDYQYIGANLRPDVTILQKAE